MSVLPESGVIADIGTRRELFVDDWLIDAMQGACLQLNKPERREVALSFDGPLEDPFVWASRVLPSENGWRMYYRASYLNGHTMAMTAVMESQDGVAFVRPDAGRFEYMASKRNNIVHMREGYHDLPPFLDANPDCLPEQRFKALATKNAPKDVDGFERPELYALTSPDGLHWSLLQSEPLKIAGQFDTINTAFFDVRTGCYRSYTRVYYDPTTGRKRPNSSGDADRAFCRDMELRNIRPTRGIQHAMSADFIHWTEPELLQYGDGEDATQLYTNAIVPCPGAEHVYLGFPNRFMEDRRSDSVHPEVGINDALFMSSRDGVRWNRWLEAWVGPGLDPLNWTDRNNYPVWGIAETSLTEWSMYISEHYRRNPVRVRRLAIRPWGFVSVRAGFTGGELLTKPFIFSGSFLHLNARTSAAGSIQVEVQDGQGRPVPGFALVDMVPWYGDALDAVVAWKNGCDLSRLAGLPVRLRFSLKDADIFALQFVKRNVDAHP